MCSSDLAVAILDADFALGFWFFYGDSPDVLAQRDEADSGDNADEIRRDAEDLVDEEASNCVDGVHVLTLLWGCRSSRGGRVV